MKQFFTYTCTLNTPLKNFAGCMDQGDLLLNLLRHQQELRMTPQEQEEIKALSIFVVNQMTQEVINKTCLISHQYPVRVLFFARTSRAGSIPCTAAFPRSRSCAKRIR